MSNILKKINFLFGTFDQENCKDNEQETNELQDIKNMAILSN